MFSFFRERVVNITISDLRPVSNESLGNFTFYRGIREFLNASIFVINNGSFEFYAVVFISQKIPWNDNYSPKTVIIFKNAGILDSVK